MQIFELVQPNMEWFRRMKDACSVLWWVPAGHRSSIDEARQELDLIRRDGPGPVAFTFKDAFPPPV